MNVSKVYTNKLPSDSNNFSGIWFSIHLYAKSATTYEAKRCFHQYIHSLAKEFRCLECQSHFQAYLKSNPVEKYFNVKNSDGEDIGCFKWSYLFHNAVNARIGKPILDWKDAYDMYYDKMGICSSSCGH